MKCKFYDEFTGMCTNGACPMRADCCPVPDMEGVCRHEERADVYDLTPKGCALAALQSAGLLEGNDMQTLDRFWEMFQQLMEKFGYVRSEDGSNVK